jgi:DNA polymerase-3 subunit delta'
LDLSRNSDRKPAFFMETPAWRDVVETFETGLVPHCWAISAPLAWQEDVLSAWARMALCDAGRGGDGCEGCLGWGRRGQERGESGVSSSVLAHPDMTVAGEFDKAGNIESCRALAKELLLKPVVAKRRIGVVLAADKLLIHAANSLLKIAEEPPSHVCLLFLLEGNDFLPTLRSRSRFTTLAAPLSLTAAPMPETEAEWLGWLERMGKLKEEADLAGLLSSWTSSLLEKGELALAAKTERLRLLVLQKKLSQNMACDLLTLTLKEELPFEHIFSGVW